MIQTRLEWLKAVGAIVTAVGAIIAAVSLYLAYLQLQASIRWNKINATFTYLPEAMFQESERAAARALATIDVDLYKQEQPLTPEAVARVLGDSQVLSETKNFINLFELYATAYKAGAIDNTHSYVLSGSQFIRYYFVFKPLIDTIRSQRKNDMYWVEFETLVIEDWQIRQSKEIKDAALKRRKMREGERYP